jgi:hypothetical protein
LFKIAKLNLWGKVKDWFRNFNLFLQIGMKWRLTCSKSLVL